MTYKTLILLSTMLASAMVHSSDIPVVWAAGQTPATLADGKLTLAYDGGGNVATIVATPAKDERIVIGGDTMAMAENATITMDNSAGECGQLVIRNEVNGSGALTCRSAVDDSVITWEADSKSTALDVSPNWKLLFPGKRLSEYEPVESNQDASKGGKDLPSGPSNPNRMVARCITRGTDADGRDTMEFQLHYAEYSSSAGNYLKNVKVQLRQGPDGIEGIAVSASYTKGLLFSADHEDADYIAVHAADYPGYQNVNVWGPSHTASGLAYGTYMLTVRRTSGLPRVQFENLVTDGTSALPLVIAKGVEVKGAGAMALADTNATAARTIEGQLTVADERTFNMRSSLTGGGTLRIQRDVDGVTTNFLKNLYNYDQSMGSRFLEDLTNAVGKLTGGAFSSTAVNLYHYHVAESGLVATGQLQGVRSKTLGCVFVEFTQDTRTVKVKGVKAGYVSTSAHKQGEDFNTFSDVTWTNFVNTTKQEGLRVTTANFYWKAKDFNYAHLSGGADAYALSEGARIEIGGGEGGDEFVAIDYPSMLPTNGCLEVLKGGIGMLTAPGDGRNSALPALADGYSKGTCKWVVRKGGQLWHAYGAHGAVGKANQEIELDGGLFYAAHPWNTSLPKEDHAGIFVSLLTMANGGRLVGDLPVLAGYANANALWKIRGTSPSYCDVDVVATGADKESSLKPLRFDVYDVTGDEDADFVMNGALRRFTWMANKWSTVVRKYGLGTLRLNGVCTADNAYDKTIELYDGTWLLGASGVAAAPFQLNGGTLAAAEGAVNEVGTLTVAKAGAINVAEGAVLSFADSSEVEWTAGAGERVIVTADLTKNSVRFGTDANGLTAGQLRVLRNAAGKRVALDENGWLRDGNFGMVITIR